MPLDPNGIAIEIAGQSIFGGETESSDLYCGRRGNSRPTSVCTAGGGVQTPEA